MTKSEIIKATDALFKHLKKEVSIYAIEATRPKDSAIIYIDFAFLEKGKIDSIQFQTTDYAIFEVWQYKTKRTPKGYEGYEKLKIATIKL